jgi:PAS domain S-box-containing protein
MNSDPIRILFVEDNAADRRAFELFVEAERLPYEVTFADSVETAKREIIRQSFEAIVSDFRLHDGTVLDLIDRVKAVPVVVITGLGDERVAVTTLQAGAADYLIKDAENRHLQTLPVAIRNAISRKKNEAELADHRLHLEARVAERTRELEREIAERRSAEDKLRSVNNSLRMLTACNQAMFREKTIENLLNAACRIVADIGGYRMAWIGRAESDDDASITPLAQGGHVDGYFSDVLLRWSDSPSGSCPEGRAIRSGKPALCPNTASDLTFTAWRIPARKRGYGSVLAMPLSGDPDHRMVFAVYGGEPDAFPRETVRFFQELADDIGFGLSSLRLQVETRLIDEALKQSENRYRTLLESSTDAIFLIDREERIVYLNSTAASMLGGTRESLIGKRQVDFFPPDVGKRHGETLRNVFVSGEPFSNTVSELISGSASLFNTRLIPIRDGNGEIRSVMGISRDVTALVRMEEDRRKAEIAQRASEARFRRMAENAKDIIFRYRLKPAPGIDYISPAVGPITGYPAEEITANPELVRTLILPEDRHALERFARGEVEFGKMKVLRWKNREGRSVWLELVYIPVFDSSGGLEAIEGIARDVTERNSAQEKVKESLKEKEILLKETHHRVKNNLQVISSLLRLQAAYIRDPGAKDMFLETQNRIRSMALIHEKLYQSRDLDKVHFPDYIKMLAADLYKLYDALIRNIGLTLDVQDVSMNIGIAVPCGLIVNELLSNALKHAFPPRYKGKGMVKIGLVRTPEKEFHLTVGDNGVGLPGALDLPNVTSLGLHLVRILVQDQLGGKIRVVRKNGTVFRIVFKP